VEGNVIYTGGGNLPYDVEIQIQIEYYNSITYVTSNISAIMSRLTPSGAPGNTLAYFRHDRGYFLGLSYQRSTIMRVRPHNAVDPSYYFDIPDSTPNLTVDSTDKKIISCSATISEQGVYPFFFSGSDVPANTASLTASLTLYNTYCPPDYRFFLSPGDIVRFDGNKTGSVPTTDFLPDNEYTIMSVNTTGSRITFTVDRPVDDAVTSSIPYRIERYVFSRRFEDESNIVIIHKKQPGQTSSGIVKNINLEFGIDEKVADIVSELKSKIFSTVLIQ
jgi:hypothetical protein